MFFSWDKNFDPQLYDFLKEDGLSKMSYGLLQHPQEVVETQILWKCNLLVAGMPLVCSYLSHFCKTENLNLESEIKMLMSLEGKFLSAGTKTKVSLPFHQFIFLERTLLNVLHRLSAIATTTSNFVKIAQSKGVEILDTRKTTPGLREMERYAVAVGGGKNHRFDYTDCLMIKDNQKKYFGGLQKAWNYYQSKKSFYQVIIVEIHSLEELKIAADLGVKHLMLDNFSVAQIKEALQFKKVDMTFEISGGVNLDNIQDYVISGVDAISLSSITFWPNRVDISWKIL